MEETLMRHVMFRNYTILLQFYLYDTGNLIVAFDGDAKLAQGNKEGLYTLTSYLVNGKQTWINDQGSNAIWYDKVHKNWRIGPKENLGASTCSLYSTNDAKIPEKATTWKYVDNDGKWMPTSNIFGSKSMYYIFQILLAIF
jgi:hypothetical protein